MLRKDQNFWVIEVPLIIQIRYVFEWIHSDYDSLTNERELRLIEKFADRGTHLCKIVFYFFLLGFVPNGLLFLLILYNIETPINQTRTVLMPINVEYFVDQDRYFYWIMFHIDATTLLCISILICTESTFIHFITHACGLLEITGFDTVAPGEGNSTVRAAYTSCQMPHCANHAADRRVAIFQNRPFHFNNFSPNTLEMYAYSEGKYSHIYRDRMERMLETSILNVSHGKTYLSIHGQLVAAITLHQRTLKFIENMNTSLLPHYCIIFSVGVVSLSMNLYIVAKEMLLTKVTVEMTTPVILIVIHLFYMGCANYIGQILLDNGDKLFTKTYYARWSEAPLPVQKMLLYMRQRSMLPTGVVFGGLYTASFQFFSKLVNVSMSYFTVLYSTA